MPIDPFMAPSPFERRILIHYGEIALKGRNRIHFEQSLQRSVNRRLKAEGLAATAQLHHDRLCVVLSPSDATPMRDIMGWLREVPGIVNVAPSLYGPQLLQDPEAALAWLRNALLALASDPPPPDGRFAVRVNRAFKKFPMSSTMLERELGSHLVQHSPWQRVDLVHPTRTFQVEIHGDGLYCHTGVQQGLGGLPLGSAGHVLALLSGGIDSPVCCT
jgi:thiamine biosynthesis protein ThiI